MNIIAPGRICLFGDHQDYLELPVIACAINRDVCLSSEENETGQFHIRMPDIQSERIISIDDTFPLLEVGDHFASAIRVVRRNGCIPNIGFDIELKSTIPINAGVSSSSAIVVAWIHFLLKAYGSNRKLTAPFIAQLAYEAEVLEHNSPGGKMDQYTIALGNIIYIDTNQNFSFEKIGTEMDGLILGVSGIPKKTIGLLGELKGKAQKAIAQVKAANPKFNLEETTIAEIESLSEYVSEELQPYFYAAIKNHHITQQAQQHFKKTPPNLKTIGTLMSEHHNVLKNTLKITVPRIDNMISAALKAGAYGAKIVGSGGGGSIVALSPLHNKLAVINAIKKAGAIDAYEVSVVKGTYIL
ncbi:MAG: galactokinase [Flavobacteriaceae bacterium]|nr:galactokinase [Flavobacteriaceae bacterium]